MTSAGSTVAFGIGADASGASAVGTAVGGIVVAASPIVGAIAVGGAIGAGIGWCISKLLED